MTKNSLFRIIDGSFETACKPDLSDSVYSNAWDFNEVSAVVELLLERQLVPHDLEKLTFSLPALRPMTFRYFSYFLLKYTLDDADSELADRFLSNLAPTEYMRNTRFWVERFEAFSVLEKGAICEYFRYRLAYADGEYSRSLIRRGISVWCSRKDLETIG